MATAKAQKKWRDRHRLVKKQLNVMAGTAVHGYLEGFAGRFGLRGKGESVTFAALVTQMLIQRSDYNTAAAQFVEDFARAYFRDRDIYAP